MTILISFAAITVTQNNCNKGFRYQIHTLASLLLMVVEQAAAGPGMNCQSFKGTGKAIMHTF